MIVVDSSVIIDGLNNVPTRQAELWKSLVREGGDQIIIGDVVLLEVLRGLRDDREARLVETELMRFETAAMLDPALAILAASHYRRLRSLGITIRKTIDLIIASFCIANNHILLHRDRDFEPMCRHLGLRTLAALPH